MKLPPAWSSFGILQGDEATRGPTGADDLLAGDGGRRDLGGELEHGLVGVFVGVGVNVGLEGLQLVWGVPGVGVGQHPCHTPPSISVDATIPVLT